MKKKLLKNLAILTFFMCSMNLSAQDVDLFASVDVTPPLTVGQTFNYTLEAVAGTTDFVAVQVYLDYNPAVIQVNSLTPDNSVLPLTLVNDIGTSGVIRYAAVNFIPVSGTFTVFTVEFEVISTTDDVMIIHDLNAGGNPNGTGVSGNFGGPDILGTANDIILATLSVDQTEFSNGISIFPNPVSDVLNIKLNTSQSEIDKIKVFSIDGKLIQEYNAISLIDNNIKLDTSMLNRAMYFVTITSTENELATFKMVVN